LTYDGCIGLTVSQGTFCPEWQIEPEPVSASTLLILWRLNNLTASTSNSTAGFD